MARCLYNRIVTREVILSDGSKGANGVGGGDKDVDGDGDGNEDGIEESGGEVTKCKKGPING